MKLEKWHGAGNDFLVVDGRAFASSVDWASWTPAACDRRRGVGADGLLVLEPETAHSHRKRREQRVLSCGFLGRSDRIVAISRVQFIVHRPEHFSVPVAVRDPHFGLDD